MIELTRKMALLERTLEQLLAGLHVPPQWNNTATTAPGITDDADDGYKVGSLWTNVTTDTGYMCMDATIGAAVWKQITA